MDTQINKSVEIRKAKMVAEGGPIYPREPRQSNVDKIATKAMISEGGLGAWMYYNEDGTKQRDIMEDKQDYVN